MHQPLNLFAMAALALAAALPAHASSLPTNGNWVEFSVDANLPPYSLDWLDQFGDKNFEFVIPVGFKGTLTVVDTGFSGDRFTVMNGATLLGQTSVATQGDINGAIEFDPETALSNADYSRGVFTLAAGQYSIRGWLSQSALDGSKPLNATIGGIKLEVSPVPEPASLATLLAGLYLLSVFMARRQNDRK